MKIRQVRTYLLHADRQTHDETNSRLSQILRTRPKRFKVISTKTNNCRNTSSGTSTFSTPRRSYRAIKQCTKHTSRT